LRIAFFADSYKPYISGVTNSIETLTNELRALGHTVYIFAPDYPGEKGSDPDIIRFPSLPTGYPGFRIAIPLVPDMPPVDIIHSHSPFQAGLLAKYLARRKKVPFVYTFHTLFTRYVHYAGFIPEGFSKFVIANYIRGFCRNCDLVIAPSLMARRVLRRWGSRTRCEVVPTGVEISKYNEESWDAARKHFGLPQNAKVLLYVGRISREKNIPFLIEAFKKMDQPNLYFLLLGGGPLLPELRAQNIKNVIFGGEIEHDKVLNLYSAGDIFVFASKTETQGLVLAEAKGAGLPVVALFAGGLVDTVRAGIDGYLTQRNTDSFIEHVKRLLDDNELRRKMGEEAKKDALDRFSSSHVAKRIETLYNSLIK